MRTKSGLHGLLGAVLSLTGVVLVWEAAGRLGLYDILLFPIPTRVLHSLVRLGAEGILWTDIVTTVARVITGFLSGSLLGFGTGLVTGRSPRIRRYLEPIIQVARPVPAVALVPLAIVWFGIGEIQKYFIVSWASFFPVWVNTHTGVGRVPHELLWTASVLGATKARVFREVVVPWSLPFVQAGTRIALGLAFTATVVAEMSGASAGLGFRIIASHLFFQVDQMIGAILLIGALGAALDRAFVATTRRLLPWLET